MEGLDRDPRLTAFGAQALTIALLRARKQRCKGQLLPAHQCSLGIKEVYFLVGKGSEPGTRDQIFTARPGAVGRQNLLFNNYPIPTPHPCAT